MIDDWAHYTDYIRSIDITAVIYIASLVTHEDLVVVDGTG